MYRRMCLTALRCSAAGFSMKWLTYPTAKAMSGRV
uniref:Uncharacterized protein n=1 Tax=Arundo donax TaxID=35708 RepID=A0A0A8YVM8_ARUDO